MATQFQDVFNGIASAIVEKGGTTSPILPSEMPAAIRAIPSSGGGEWGSITGDLDDQLDLKSELDRIESSIPYSKSSSAGTRRVMVVSATSDTTATLPSIPDTDEVLNCDIIVNAKSASADFGLSISAGSGVQVHYPDGDTVTCKHGCVTMVSCVGVNGLGWLVVSCNNLRTAP